MSIDSLALLLKLLSTVCSAASLAAFVYWIMQEVSSSYEKGRATLEHRENSHAFFNRIGPLWDALNRVTIALLPTINRLRAGPYSTVAKYLRILEYKLIRAGVRSESSPEQILALSVLAGVASALVFAALLSFILGFGIATIVLVPLAAASGFYLPSVFLDNIIANRISMVEKRLPFAIEFIVLSMEARAAFPAAIKVYCDQMEEDPLSEELTKTLRDVNFGMSFQEALRKMSDRLHSADVSAFVLALNTGLDTGQPVQQVLQTQSDVARQRRYQSAEQVAKTASTRAIFPLFIVALAVLLLLVGPLIIRLAEQTLF